MISTAIKRAITRFDQAAQAVAFKGAAHPESRSYIQLQYERAREALERAIAKEIAR